MLQDSTSAAPLAKTGTASANAVRGLARDWLGRLELRFGRRDERTIVTHRRHVGPLLVQRSFHPEGGPCHSYIIHPPGGVAGGDRLLLDVALDAEAHALITTPAAAKFYRSGGDQAQQRQTFRLGNRACCEFLPAETILHGGCDVRLDTRFELAATARLCLWDVVCLGRPGSGDHYADGRLQQTLTVTRNGTPLFHDALRANAGDAALQAPWGLAGYPVIGTLLATLPRDEAVDAAALVNDLRQSSPDRTALRWGVTRLQEALLVRCLGTAVEPVKHLLEQLWTRLRPALFDREACPPRIWRT